MAAAAKIKEFYDKGGMVIATTALPTKSAEFGHDKEVRQAIADVFGVTHDGAVSADVRRAQDRQNFYVFWYYIKKNKAGGQAIFLPNTHPWLMDFALKQVLPLRDVDIQEPMGVLKRGPDYDGALTYIHKVKNDRDIYFFANSSPKAIDTKVVLRGKKDAADLESSHRGTGSGRGHASGSRRAAGNDGAAGVTPGVVAVLHSGIAFYYSKRSFRNGLRAAAR